MKNLKKKSTYIILITLLFGFLIVQNILLLNLNIKFGQNSQKDDEIYQIKMSYTQVSPFVISPYSGYDWDDAVQEDWCNGNGTKDNP
ncbi:MAG: hypothetical protein R6W84_16225, partial [Promethearchaeia archaeon]